MLPQRITHKRVSVFYKSTSSSGGYEERSTQSLMIARLVKFVVAIQIHPWGLSNKRI